MKLLRNYDSGTQQYNLYKDMHRFQTLEYVKKKKQQYATLNNVVLTMKDALSKLNNFVDPSDPDLDEENIIHAYQTAERIRHADPKNKELQIIGLIHDVGKILYSFSNPLPEPPWAVVGDTFVLGCKFPESIVYYDTMRLNPDYEKYDEQGIYDHGCGLDKLYISFGHDEYLYQVLLQNQVHGISKKNMDIIRFHSFYPWHNSGCYKQFESEYDKELLNDVKYFNSFDLYSKEDTEFVLTDEIKSYYDDLLDEFFPEKLQF